MPNCFQLSRKSDPQAGPVALNTIDRELCQLLDEPEHERHYCHGWFDWIGFNLAMGRDFPMIRATMAKWGRTDPVDTVILDWFENNFTPDSWVEIGKR